MKNEWTEMADAAGKAREDIERVIMAPALSPDQKLEALTGILRNWRERMEKGQDSIKQRRGKVMAEERQISRDNLLVARDITIEPACGGLIAFHFIMEDRLAVWHRVSFAVKEYAADTVLRSVIKRMRPINLPEEPPAAGSAIDQKEEAGETDDVQSVSGD